MCACRESCKIQTNTHTRISGWPTIKRVSDFYKTCTSTKIFTFTIFNVGDKGLKRRQLMSAMFYLTVAPLTTRMVKQEPIPTSQCGYPCHSDDGSATRTSAEVRGRSPPPQKHLTAVSPLHQGRGMGNSVLHRASN